MVTGSRSRTRNRINAIPIMPPVFASLRMASSVFARRCPGFNARQVAWVNSAGRFAASRASRVVWSPQLLQKTAPDAVIKVVSQLGDALPQREELVDVVWTPEVRRLLHRQHDSDLLVGVHAGEVSGVIDAQQQIAVGGEESVPFREESQTVFVVGSAFTEREHLNPGALICSSIARRKAPRLGQPEIKFVCRFLRKVGETELVEKVHYGGFRDKLDRTRRIFRAG